MGFQPTPFTLTLVAAVLVGVPLGYAIEQRRDGRGARPLLALVGTAGLWGVGALVGSAATTIGGALWWHNLAVTAAGLCVFSWVVFVVQYVDREELLTDRVMGALAVEPAVVTLLAWAGTAGPFYDAARVEGGALVASFGIGFWVHEVYVTLLFAGGAVVLARHLLRYRDGTTDRSVAIAVAIAAPVLAGLPYGLSVAAVDLRPAGFLVTAGALSYATFRADLVDVTPVAHDTIVENMSDGVFVLDADDRIVEINPMAKRILGIDDEHVLGRHAREVLSVYPGLYDRYEAVTEIQEEIGLDDGERRRFFHIQVSPLFDRHGDRSGRLFLIHEITDQKRRQRELRRQNERLDQFASLVSHDLRNPLNVAEGFTELAKDTGDVGYLDRVEDSLDRMSHLIEDVLTLARDGQTITETEPVSIDGVAQSAWENVETARATLEVVDDVEIEASHDRLLRVFENLFRNAVEHGGDDVRIRVGALATGDQTKLAPDRRGFYVEDDGPGIPEAERDAVLEDGYTTSEDGVGLGLSIVTSIVDAHEWDIRVTDSAEGGARFEITGVEPADGDADKRPARADGGE